MREELEGEPVVAKRHTKKYGGKEGLTQMQKSISCSDMKDFAAIDFETANNERSSVCSVGIVVVRDGEIVDKFYSYPART